MYGIKESMNQELSAQEINRMREIVLSHDKQNQNQEIDLSKPVIVPYTHKEFPKMVYDHAKSEPGFWAVKKTANGEDLYHVPAKLVSKTVKNEAELKAALKSGFEAMPPVLEDCNDQDSPHIGFGRPAMPEKGAPVEVKAS